MVEIRLLKKKTDIIILTFIFLFAGGIRLFFLFNSDNLLGIIPIAGIVNANNLTFDFSSFANNWHIGSDLLIRWSLFLGNSSLLSPRILMVLLSTLTIIPFYKLNRLFFNMKISLISSVLLSVYPMYLNLSSVTITQIPFIFFLFWGLYYFFKFTKVTGKIKDLTFASIFFNITTMFRFEAILFIFILGIFLLFSKYKKFFIFFTFFSLLFFLFNLSLSAIKKGDFLEYLVSTSIYARAEINFGLKHGGEFLNFPSTFSKKIMAWPIILYLGYGPIFFYPVIFGLLISFFKKRNFELALVGIFAMLSFMLQTFAENLVAHQHYSIIFGVLFIPYAGVGIHTFFNSLTHLWWNRKNKFFKILFYNILCVSLILIIIFFSSVIAYKNRPILPKYIKNVANWLHENVKDKNAYIIIDMDKWQLYYEHIILLSGLDRDNFLVEPFKVTDFQRYVDKEKVIDFLNTKHPKYLVFSPGGLLSEMFPFKKRQQFNVAYGYLFRKEYEVNTNLEGQTREGEYIVYSIKKGSSIYPPLH